MAKAKSGSGEKAKIDGADHIYKVIELVGTSDKSVEDAIQNAITRASKTLKHLRWFEATHVRGSIVNGKTGHYQVTLKIGFTLEDPNMAA